MTANVEVDFAYNEPLQSVLTQIRKHGGRIGDFDPNGPAGGNPTLLLHFAEVDGAASFLRERYPDDPEEFIISRITAH